MDTEQATKQRIMTLMRDRMLQSGFSKVTLDEIAADLAISKKTLYKYFSGKDDLALQTVRFMFVEIEASFNAVQTSQRTFAEKFQAVMMIVRERVSRISSFALQDMRRHAPELWNEIDRLRHERIFTKLEGMVRSAREEGVLRPEIDERILVKMIMASAEAVANPTAQDELAIPMQDIIQSMFRIIFEGALTDEVRKSLPIFPAADVQKS